MLLDVTLLLKNLNIWLIVTELLIKLIIDL